MEYNPVTEEVIAELAAIAGEKNVITAPDRLNSYACDEIPRERFGRAPEVVVTPRSAEEISRVMELANTRRIPVTPRGAGSGLSGGAIPEYGGILLSLERMDRILEIDRENLLAVCEPGVVTNELNAEVAAEGLFFAGYPMSVESCFVGGNIAENAGGGKAVKYGVTGRYILGLEVVLPTGEIVNFGGRRVKDVTGYDLKQLLIGSEGTLGIITRAIIRLLPLPTERVDLLVLFPDTESAIAVVPEIMSVGGVVPTSIEYMDRLSVETSCTYLNESLPYEEAGAMLLIEVDGQREEQVWSEAETIGELCLARKAQEVYVADNHTTRERVWSVRRNIAEAFKVYSPHQSLEDIVVPISSIPQIMNTIGELACKYDLRIPCYGHAGDGNLHATLVKNPDLTMEEWYATEDRVLEELYTEVQKLGGTISGEHGIGSKRRDFLHLAVGPVEMELMRRIKRAFDPHNILNPGKILPCADGKAR